MSPNKHWQPLLIDDVAVHPSGTKEIKISAFLACITRFQKGRCSDQEPVKQGELTESPDSHCDNRSRNLTDAAMDSPTFIVVDVEVGNSSHVCARAFHIHLRALIEIL